MKPKVRAQCGPLRPCPWVSCRYHLYNERPEKFAYDVEFDQIQPDTCALDVAERGPLTQQEIADLYGLTHQRICQIEISAMRKLKRKAHILDITPWDMDREPGIWDTIASMAPGNIGDLDIEEELTGRWLWPRAKRRGRDG